MDLRDLVPLATVEQAAGGFRAEYSPLCYNGVSMKNNLLYAYFAGAVDADGFITIGRSTRKVGERYAHRPTYYIAKVGYVSTDKTVPCLLRESFGGSLNEHQPKNTAHKLVYLWQCTNAKAGTVANALLPYLRMKRAQAVIVLEFIRRMDSRRHREMKLGVTPEIEAERRELWEAVTHLNAPRNRRVHFVETPALAGLKEFPQTESSALVHTSA